MTAPSEATAVQRTTTGADRYPGVLPFGDTPLDWLRFFGREDESRALLHQLLSVDLLAFFGRSGVGKTSLLKAALFPLLRKRDFLPLPIRFNESGTPLEILQNAVAEACESEQVDYTAGTNGSLWEFFKTAIFWRDDRVQTPVLLLDQFEEVFTIQSEEFRRALAAELGQLTISRLPEHLRHRSVGREPEIGATRHSFTEKPPEMKILIGLREDYLGALQEFAPAVPEILLNRFRLTGLSEENARRAIIEPAILVSNEVKFSTEPFTYTEDTLSRMIAVAREDEEGNIEPFVLQILCSHAEKHAHDKQTAANSGNVGPPQEKQGSTSNVVLSRGVLPEVDFGYLGVEKEIQVITTNFYLDALKRLPNTRLRRRARAVCEEELLTGAGRRLFVLGDDLRERFKLPQQAIDTLEDACLLRKETRHGSFYYEISHDRIAEAIHQSRRWRLPRKVQIRVAIIIITTIVAAVFYSSYRSSQDRIAAQQSAQAQAQKRIDDANLKAQEKLSLADKTTQQARDERDKILEEKRRWESEKKDLEKQLGQSKTALEQTSRQIESLKKSQGDLLDFFEKVTSSENLAVIRSGVDWNAARKEILDLPPGQRKNAVFSALLYAWKDIPFQLGGNSAKGGFDSPRFIARCLSQVGLRFATNRDQPFSVAIMNGCRRVETPRCGDLMFYKGYKNKGYFGMMYLAPSREVGQAICIGTFDTHEPVQVRDSADFRTDDFPFQGFFSPPYTEH
jgi:hypothetical protein